MINTFLIFGLLFTFYADASPLATPDLACRCNVNIVDPFEEPLRFETPGNRGLCVDSCRFRRARQLSGETSLSVANVLHEGKFWVAEIDPESATTIDALFEDFLPAVSHLALRVSFTRPVRLRLQTDPSISSQTQELLLSVESALPPNKGLEFSKGQSGDYLLSYRIITVEEAKRWMLGEKKHEVRLFRLKVAREQVPNFVKLALKRSEERSFQVPYYLLFQNCSTSAFELLDEATGMLPPTGLSWYRRAWPVKSNMGTLAWLFANGLIERRLPDLGK